MGDNVLHIGPEYAQSLVNMRRQVWEDVCSACNTPSTLILGKAISAGHREAYRTWLRTSVTPVMRKVETIIREGLNLNQFTLHIEGVMSADIGTLARAWASLVDKGKDPAEADRLCGFD